MEMRTALLAVLILALGTLVAPLAMAQTTGTSDQSSTTSSGSSTGAHPSTTAGQSIAGTTSGGPSSSIATQTMPAPVATTPPINPNLTTTAPLTNTPPQRTARLRRHSLMGTSNSFQNGINGTVQSNGVANGTATMTPPPLAAPTPPAKNGSSTNNGPQSAPGTVATPTPSGQ